jgi:hypothetical protein
MQWARPPASAWSPRSYPRWLSRICLAAYERAEVESSRERLFRAMIASRFLDEEDWVGAEFFDCPRFASYTERTNPRGRSA